MTAHANCNHPSTKADRAACRKGTTINETTTPKTAKRTCIHGTPVGSCIHCDGSYARRNVSAPRVKNDGPTACGTCGKRAGWTVKGVPACGDHVVFEPTTKIIPF